jgi:hypothetical protein
MKTFDLEYLEEGAKTKPTAIAPKKAGFGRKARPRRLGDLRLLGLSAGIIALCVLCVVIWPGELSAPETVMNTEEVAAYTPPVLAGVTGDRGSAETGFDGEPIYDELVEMEEADALTRERTPEERERLMREMARNIPEGEVLIW